MAGTKIAVAVALVAMLLVSGTAGETCVNQGHVMSACMNYCEKKGHAVDGCCQALRHADVGCLCHNYWNRLQGTSYAGCARDIQSQCGLAGCY